MKKVSVIKGWAVLLLLLSAKTFSLDFYDSGNPETLSADLVENMTDEQVLAQTLMFGWRGITRGSQPDPLILDWIVRRHIGGVKVFGWNTNNTLELAETIGIFQTEAVKGPFHIPLLVATDQEGGWIRHVKGSTSQTPGNMALGASGYIMDAYWSGYYIGRELALLGINMNFAPVVDLYTNRDSVLIGPRSFGVDPVQAGILGAAFMKGHHETGVIATAKHYPGHGDTALDSHGVLPQMGSSFDMLWERELVPYRLMIREGVSAIMTGHIAFPNTPAGPVPASLSSWFLLDMLRDRMGFKGVIITDDLRMNGAVLSAGNLSLAAKQALAAGNDIVLLSETPYLYDAIWTRLITAMRQEPDFRSRVRDAARRIIAVKLKYLRGEKAVPLIPDLKKVETNLPDPEGTAFFLDMAARSVTLVKETALFPLTPEKAGKILLTGQHEEFFRIGKAAYPEAAVYRYAVTRGADLAWQAQKADTVIFCLSKAEDVQALKALKDLRKRVIVLSILSPVYLDEVPWVDGAIAVYSYARSSFIAGFSAILGRIPAEGTLPFPLNEPRWSPPYDS
ncbi:MAG: glycoside hydrolase family 3 protein [Spirochaetaceae bacterium]|jgi:beta-N-acetylhexosaminidase|nr:glycoside hydrolase family 3 protein [Spirochaetaceae bacterium]